MLINVPRGADSVYILLDGGRARLEVAAAVGVFPYELGASGTGSGGSRFKAVATAYI